MEDMNVSILKLRRIRSFLERVTVEKELKPSRSDGEWQR